MRLANKLDPRPWQFNGIRSRSRVIQFLAHLTYGLRSNIPLCCALEWTYRNIVRHETEMGYRFCNRQRTGCRANFVHCWFHRRTHGKDSSQTARMDVPTVRINRDSGSRYFRRS
jgi:hypothetical protein